MVDEPLSYEYDASDARLTVRGDVDEAAATRLREVLAEVTDQATRDLDIHLSEVEFLPSAAVGVLARTQEAARGNGATITLVVGPDTLAQRVLKVCGLPYSLG